MKLRNILTIATILLCAPLTWAQIYDHLIPTNTITFDAAAEGVLPGDTVGIEAGERTYLKIINVAGTETDPVIFVNAGGKVRIGNSSLGEAIFIGNSSHFQLRGDGDPNFIYGIEIWDSGNHGIEAADESTNYEICFIEVSNVKFAGIMSKTDPQCDGTAQRGTFTQYDVSIHDNYIHDVGGEALYIGNSFYSGYDKGCGTIYPHDVVGLRVFNNRVLRTGWDGIQVGSGSSDVEIYNNYINGTGVANRLYQQNGIQIGEGTTGKCNGNTILNAGTIGIVMLGLGNNEVSNNLIVNAGEHGIFCDNRDDTLDPSFVRIYNNTIINPVETGFTCYNEISAIEFKNNLVVVPDTNYDMVKTNGSNVSVAIEGNAFARDTSSFDFINESIGDYRIGSCSAALDVGVDLSTMGLVSDKEGNSRPFRRSSKRSSRRSSRGSCAASYDAGAFEYGDLSVWVDFEDVTIFGNSDGYIDLTPIGRSAPYSYLWSDGNTDRARTGLSAGIYSVTVSGRSCTSTQRTIYITEPTELKANVTARTELANSADGSIIVEPQGGTSPYTIAWDHGPSDFSLTGLSAGLYYYTITDARSDQVFGEVFVSDGGTPIYRINCGGPLLADTHLDWDQDKQSIPSSYLVSTSSRTTGSYFWKGSQSTTAANDVLGCYRYDASNGDTMQWEFPVSNGTYAVRLYFNERSSATEAGDRVFDVRIEENIFLDALDLVASTGYNTPVEYVTIIEVSDGIIDIDFDSIAGNPQINAIAIHQLDAIPNGSPLYRINAGGINETDTEADWEEDLQLTPSPFLVSTSQLTTGSWSWNSAGTNMTEAPDNIFGNYRYDASYGEEMSWELPLETGIYRVSLFFIERNATHTSGSRVFDVDIEGQTALPSFDIFDENGYLGPLQKDFILSISDGMLDLDFTRVTGAGDPAVSGIQVERIE
ncbi:malectin domain-containing carbohydrate-binding protein [Puniceicoccaceae bacterium K14]|nr:malectin domain-containing carbohydrate-binding protein [Puniceicoccaceae bacterium K14]